MEPKHRKTIAYPYLPEGRNFLYVGEDNPYMQEAKKYALANSLDDMLKTGSIIVKDGKVIGRGANGSDYHKTHECERVKQGIPTGQGYELCEGCHPKNHGEPKAIKEARESGEDPSGADVYLWGHWWCCQSCWKAMINAGIKNVYLLEGSEVFFNNKNPNNILGRQFE